MLAGLGTSDKPEDRRWEGETGLDLKEAKALTEQLTSVIQGAAGTSGTAGRRQLTEASVPDTSAASTADSPPAQATPPAKRARA